jgi:hypothetical protein
MRDLIEQLKESDKKKKCAYCDQAAVKEQNGKPVCKGHSKGGSGC